MSAKIKLRRAVAGDSDFLFRLRNQASARKYFFDTGRVGLAEHRAWFAKKLKSGSAILIVCAGAKPVGQVRIDPLSSRRGEVSISIDDRARGTGAGQSALAKAASFAKRNKFKSLVARIRTGNPPSLIAFMKSGYQYKKSERVRGYDCYRLEKFL